MNEKQTRAKYTLEFKQEAVRQVKAGREASGVAVTLGMPKASLTNWVRADAKGQLAVTPEGKATTPAVTPEQAEIARLKAQVARLTMERDIAKKLDLHSRQVVGWSLQAHMQTALVKDALLMACFRRKPPAGLIFHSGRGSQYCSQDFQDTLTAWGIRSSMSRKGNCWDNAPTESLWGRLKTACVHGQRFATCGQARQAIMDWIAFYNHSRLHSALGHLSPMQFEQRWLAAQRKSAA